MPGKGGVNLWEGKPARPVKYIAKAYDRVNLILRKDGPQNKAAVQSAADSAGESLNAYIVGALAQRMERDASRHAAETQGGVQCD